MNEDPLLSELKRISKILLLANARLIEAELSKVIRTNERRKMWVLIDGDRMPQQIAQESQVSAAAVSNFLASSSAAGLVDYVKGRPPRRLLDYVPAEWVDLTIRPEAIPEPFEAPPKT